MLSGRHGFQDDVHAFLFSGRCLSESMKYLTTSTKDHSQATKRPFWSVNTFRLYMNIELRKQYSMVVRTCRSLLRDQSVTHCILSLPWPVGDGGAQAVPESSASLTGAIATGPAAGRDVAQKICWGSAAPQWHWGEGSAMRRVCRLHRQVEAPASTNYRYHDLALAVGLSGAPVYERSRGVGSGGRNTSGYKAADAKRRWPAFKKKRLRGQLIRGSSST